MFHKTINEEQLCFIKTVALVKFQKQDRILFEKTTSQNTTLYPHIHKHQLDLPTIGPVRKSTVSHTALFWTSQAYSVKDSSMRDCDWVFPGILVHNGMAGMLLTCSCQAFMFPVQVKMCQIIHQDVVNYSQRFLDELSRYNYVTPTSYLELLGIFSKLIGIKKNELVVARKRTKTGLDKVSHITRMFIKPIKERYWGFAGHALNNKCHTYTLLVEYRVDLSL